VAPSGADTQVQFNDAGAMAGDSGLTFNKTTNVLTATGGVTAFRQSAALPATCTVGDYYTLSTEPKGQGLYYCSATNVWSVSTQSVFNVKAYGAKGDGATDDTTSIQGAATAAGVDGVIVLPVGTYKISSSITVGKFATVRGHGVVIKPTSAFPEIATTEAVFRITTYPLGTIDSLGPTFEGMSIQFTQPWASIANRAAIKRWRAFYLTGVRNVTMRDINIEQAWIGITNVGIYDAASWYAVTSAQVGGSRFERIQISSFGVAVDIDGMLHTSTYDSLELWPFGLFDVTKVTLAQRAAVLEMYYDPANIGMQIGRADHLVVQGAVFVTGTATKFISGLDGAGGGVMKFSDCDWDGRGGLMMDSGSPNVSVVNSHFTVGPAGVTAGATYYAIQQKVGDLFVDNCTIAGSTGQTVALVQVDIDTSVSPHFTIIRGSNIGNTDVDVSLIQQKTNAATTDYRMILEGNHFSRYANTAFTKAMVSIEQAGTGAILTAQGNTTSTKGTGVGAVFNIVTDTWHRIVNNQINGWTTSFPAVKTLGVYQDTFGQMINPQWTIENAAAAYFNGVAPNVCWNDTTGAADFGCISYDAGYHFFDLAAVGGWKWRGAAYAEVMVLSTSAELSKLHSISLVNEAAPANPAAGNIKLYADVGTGNLTCLKSTGASCLGSGTGDVLGNANLVNAGYPVVVASAGTVTQTATLGVTRGGTGLAAGTSGGVPYFSAATTLASSGALTAQKLVVGGGAGATPTSSLFTDSGTITGVNAVRTGSEFNVQQAAAAGATESLSLDGYSGGAVAVDNILGFVSSRGTIGTPTAVQTSDLLADIRTLGYGATALSASDRGGLKVVAAENWTDAAQGTYISLKTTAVGAATAAVERVRIDEWGLIPPTKAFADLGTPAAGHIVYCSDCTVASPCNNGGTGAIAKRLAAAWVCN